MEIVKEVIEKIKKIVTENQTFMITTHHNSDGDAMGAATAMAEVLRQMGKTVKIILPNDFPAFYKWLHGVDDIINFGRTPKDAQAFLANTEVEICMDFNNLGRIDRLEAELAKSERQRIVIDHHLGLDMPANAIVSVPEASSTCELLYHVLQACGYGSYINKDVAESIYTGILTDTGRLDYSSSYSAVYQVVGALVDMGIRKTYIHDNIYNVYSYNRMNLLATVMKENLVFLPKYHAAYMTITIKNQKEHKFQLGDSEGFVNVPLQISDVKFCALFTEYEKSQVKVSLRSKGNFPASSFATDYFMGGGHFNAAGGRFTGSLQEAVQTFCDGLKQYKDKL